MDIHHSVLSKAEERNEDGEMEGKRGGGKKEGKREDHQAVNSPGPSWPP